MSAGDIDTRDDAAWQRHAIYTGRSMAPFWQSVGGMFLVVLTLGIYGFWLRTKHRRYYWSNLVIARHPMEYTGRGVELFIGALIAIVVLTVYLVVAFLALNTLNVTLFEFGAGAQITLLELSLLPLLLLTPYAIYRAQRYFVTRLRWRGIRLTMERAAVTYWGRGILWFFAQVLTLGLITPIADYNQRAFITRRMGYGDIKFELGGSSGGLYRPFIVVVIGILLMLGAGYALFSTFAGFPTPGDDAALYFEQQQALLTGLGLFYGALLFLIIGYAWYSSCRMAYFIRHTTLGGSGLSNQVSGGSVFWLQILTALGVGFFTWLAAIILIGLIALIAVGAGVEVGGGLSGPPIDILNTHPWLAALGVPAFILVLGVMDGVYQSIFHSGMMRRVANGMMFTDVASLDSARQLENAAQSDAGGFADAIGAEAF